MASLLGGCGGSSRDGGAGGSGGSVDGAGGANAGGATPIGGATSSGGAASSSGGAGSHGGAAASGGASSGGSVGAGGATSSGGASSGGSAGAGGATSASIGTVTGDSTHIHASLLMHAVTASAEDHVCVVLTLPNAGVAWVSSVHATLTTGSHHLIVDRATPGTAANTVPTSCAPTQASDATRLMIGQQKDTQVTLPTGVAFKLEPHQPLFLQLHYINLSESSEDIEGTVDLTLLDSSASTPTEAKSIFTGSYSISLPPHAPGTSTAYVPIAPDSGTRRNVFQLTSHTHSLGVDSTIERVNSASAAASTPIHESTSWAEPPLTQFSPPLAFTGNDGLRLTCKYQNTTDATVGFGTAFHDEMCFMWIYYYDQ
jgi:hypothetical protein